jgi:hypothetical protein
MEKLKNHVLTNNLTVSVLMHPKKRCPSYAFRMRKRRFSGYFLILLMEMHGISYRKSFVPSLRIIRAFMAARKNGYPKKMGCGSLRLLDIYVVGCNVF